MIALEKQKNYEVAFEQAMERVRRQSPDHLEFLGAIWAGEDHYTLPVLNSNFAIDFKENRIARLGGGAQEGQWMPIGIAWQILTAHYLSAPALGILSQDYRLQTTDNRLPQWVTFADIPDLRGYQSVYQGRVIGRFCWTAGRDQESFATASEQLGGKRANWGDEGFQFKVFPRVKIGIAWYAQDDELPVNASFLYPDNILEFLPPEDVIVISENLVGRLQGKEW